VIEIKSNYEAPKCLVWSAKDQISGNTASVRELTEADVNNNKIYFYYLQKVIKFAETIGLDLTKCRLRQHSDYEMAHYSTDCWDLEVELFDNSWSECVGVANRGCYDLTNHGKKSGAVHNYSAERTNEHGKVERYVPHVIEPSFGLDRLVMAVLVHNYKERLAVTDRVFYTLPPNMAPKKVGIAMAYPHADYDVYVEKIISELREAEISYKYINNKKSLGTKYVHYDELGIPYSICVDSVTRDDGTVTIRDRDTLDQIRVKIGDLSGILQNLCQKNCRDAFLCFEKIRIEQMGAEKS